MRSAFPPTAATGIPPPMIFAKVARSGWTEKTREVLPAQNRKPEITSSKMRRAPCFRVRSRAACRNARLAGMLPPDPMKGSMMKHAMLDPFLRN